MEIAALDVVFAFAAVSFLALSLGGSPVAATDPAPVPPPGPNMKQEFTFGAYVEGIGVALFNRLDEMNVRDLGAFFKKDTRLKVAWMHHVPSGAFEVFVGEVNGKAAPTPAPVP